MSENTKPASACRHMNFDAKVGVARLENVGRFDSGEMLGEAEAAKTELRAMLTHTHAAAAGKEPSKAATDVLAERQRQISVEGWTPEHDDEHSFGELARAGAAYAAQSLCAEEAELDCGPPRWWPWDRSWWKPSGRRRMLVKAGALVLAELERLDRATGKESGND